MCLKPRDGIPADATKLELLLEIVDDLAAALVNARIYRHDHPRVRDASSTVQRSVRELVGSDQEHLRLSIAGDLLVHQGQPLIGASITASRLIKSVCGIGGGGIQIDGGATAEEISALVTTLATWKSDSDWRTINDTLTNASCARVRILPPFVVGTEAGDADAEGSLIAPVKLYQSCIDMLQDVTIAICHSGRIEFDPVQTHAEAMLDQLDRRNGPLMHVARQQQHDAFTFGHSVRVAVLAMNFARTLTDDRHLLVRIGTAALLHDCGKALIPFEILHSRKALGPDERREMSKHPALGAEILIAQDGADPLAIAAAFGHHRSCDGGGYPRTVAEHHNLLVTEVVKICDVYEALTAARPYKPPMLPTRAFRVMVSMGAHLDRALLRAFIECNGLFPNGQVVELSSGELAEVTRQTGDLAKPEVRILTDRMRQPIPAEEQMRVDLRAEAPDSPRRIAAAAAAMTPTLAGH